MSIRRCALPLLLIAVSIVLRAIATPAAQGSNPAAQTAGAQEPSASPTVKLDAEKPSTDKPDYSKESFVTESMHSRFRFENDGTGRRESVLRIRVQSEAGVQRWGQLRLAYNSANERMEIPYVRVLKQDGSVVSAGPEAVQDLSGAVQQVAPVYTDYREKHVTVPGLRPGDVLEFQSVTVVHTALAPGQFWTQYDFDQTNILLDEQLEIDIPAGRTVKLKTKPGTDPVITELNGRRIYRWTSSHLIREELESAVADIHAVPSGMKAADFIRSGNEARRNGNYVLAVDLLNRAVEDDPRNKSAWNDLGLAYFDMRQDGLAINAFQKQIEINPYHEYSYNNLGRIYLRQRKYDEAEKWFHKHIEVDPLDKYAHENLGIADLEQHKYEDAIPELEKAASLTPGSAGPETRLGGAYLNVGQDEKAMAAFDRALKISATPTVWNNIAYQLALKGAHLDRARSYAESAVSTTAAGLRNVSLDQIDRRQLELAPALARYWDTLGWVEFAGGNLDKAQKYVWAAWQLSQGADATDHLGQIYEKKGDKQQAIHFYALAMSARRPEPETRERLAALLRAEDRVGAVVEEYRDELQQQRTIKLANGNKQEGKAELFLLFSAAPGSDATVDTAKLVSGDEKLKGMADVARSAKYHQAFPDDTPVKILRRGTLTCTASADCVLVLDLPDDVRSVD